MKKEIITALRSLDLSDGGSHSRLSAIASCFLEPAFGWTRGACEELKSKLIWILEGKDGNDDYDHFDGRDYGHHRCDQHRRQVSYDVLGNERHKAVCELRNTSLETGSAVKKLAHALGVKWNPDNVLKSMGLLRGRLIHLLGGDEPTLSDLYGIWQGGKESESRDSELAHKITKSAETINLSDKSDGELMENGENHKFDGCITDELRKFKGHINAGLKPEMVLALHAEINCIADRIDERARLGAIKADIWQDYANQMRAERDNLLDLLRDARDEYKMLDQMSAETSANFHAMRDKVWGLEAERDELQSTIDEMAEELDSAKAKNRRLSKKWREKCEALKAENAELQEKNRHLAQKCDAMLVLFSNRAMNAKSDQERRIEKLVSQRDELREKLKEIGDIANG